jgi:hypothetical protein
MNVINKNFLRKFFLLSEWSQTFQGLRSYAARFAAAGFRYFIVMFALFEDWFFETVLVSSYFQKKNDKKSWNRLIPISDFSRTFQNTHHISQE